MQTALPPSPETPHRAHIAFAVPYSVSVAALYLFAYWGTFDINVLEFISLGDIIKLAAYPLALSLVLMVATGTVSHVVTSDRLPPGGGADTAVGKFGRKHWRELLIVTAVLMILVALYIPAPKKWLVLMFLIPTYSVALGHVEFLIRLIPNPSSRGLVIHLLLILPLTALWWGSVKATAIKEGRAPLVVDVWQSNLTLPIDVRTLSYLGYLSGYFVLYDNASGASVFIKTKDDTPLVLQPNPDLGH